MAPALPRHSLQPRAGTGRAWDPSLEPSTRPGRQPSVHAANCDPQYRRPRPRFSPGRPWSPAPPPLRPRSPTPRVGRRVGASAASGLHHRRLQAAQCAAPPQGPVAHGNRRTPGGTAAGSGSWRAAGSAQGARALGGRSSQSLDASDMVPGERKRLSSALSDEDRKEENRIKQGITQDLVSSPKLDRYRIAKQLTEKAIKEKKIFSIYGHYPVIRAALRRKGWVEKKFHFLPKVILHVEDESEGVTENKGTESKENSDLTFAKTEDIHDVMSRLVKHEMPYFLWTIKRDIVDYHSLNCDQMLNHYGKTASFTTKIGLCVNMRNLPWYVQANPDSFFPRCYGLCTEIEQQEFLDDFRRTAASSILKWVVSHHNYKSKPKSRREEASGDTDPSHTKDTENTDNKTLTDLSGQLIDTACKVCQTYLGQVRHEDIDISEDATKDLTEDEWNVLTQQYYSLVHGDAFISSSGNYLAQCQSLLNKITSINPQTEIDGLRNIWIIKPAAKSRGRDIVCMDRVEEILKLVNADHLSTKDNKWVAQKYIETPLLIYDTKFDIRQWFLVTDWNPLTIWFYKESYLRFSTQRFSLDNLDSAVHLCNNSIQKHLKNAKDRSPLLPCYNMWTSTKFQEYLQRRGRGSVWSSTIYPSMKRAVTNTMKVAQDHVEARKNSFELYGADFILSKDFKPWLIEINSSPTMHPSTPVTAQLCAQVQEDTIKVVLDRKLDRNCDIGNFELLWRQPTVELPPFSGSDLCVEGVSFRKTKKQTSPMATLHLTMPPSGTRPLNGRCPSATPETARGSLRTTLPQDLRVKEDKLQRADGQASSAAPAGSPEPHALKVATYRGRKAAEGSFLQPLRVPGRPRDLAAPCLVCHGSFQPAKPCKRCRSFCAAVLQGGSFVKLGGGQGGL